MCKLDHVIRLIWCIYIDPIDKIYIYSKTRADRTIKMFFITEEMFETDTSVIRMHISSISFMSNN